MEKIIEWLIKWLIKKYLPNYHLAKNPVKRVKEYEKKEDEKKI